VASSKKPPSKHSTFPAQRHELIIAAVENLLRYPSPVPIVNGTTTQDTQLDGCPIAQDTKVGVLLAIANHDPEIHPYPCTTSSG
jgi:cytochrome P450